MTIELPLSHFQQLFLFIVFATKAISLSHLAHCSSLYQPKKSKNRGFLKFTGGMEMDHWA